METTEIMGHYFILSGSEIIYHLDDSVYLSSNSSKVIYHLDDSVYSSANSSKVIYHFRWHDVFNCL